MIKRECVCSLFEICLSDYDGCVWNLWEEMVWFEVAPS